MKYSDVIGYKISGLTLGTVALGTDYNVFHDQQRPARSESLNILNTATGAGINTIDTARSYGDAEDLIGEYGEDKRQELLNIVTKFKISPNGMENKDKARAEMMSSIKTSLERLGRDRLPICLFHMDSTLPLGQVKNILPELLEELKKEGLIEHGGISADDPLEVEMFLDYPVIEAIQVPVNIFDHRLIKRDFFKRLTGRNIIVFARSVFLKGLFFASPEHLKGNLQAAGPYIRQLHDLATNEGMSVSQLAFSFVKDLEGITSIVFGADKPDQVIQNVELLNGAALPAELRNRISTLFSDIPESIISPRNWSN